MEPVCRGRARARAAGAVAGHFEEWAQRYLDSDPVPSRDPAGVTPIGPFSEIIIAWHGQLPTIRRMVQRRSPSSAASGTG